MEDTISGCAPDATACNWLLDQGLPEWLAVLLGSLAAPLGQALVILVVTSVVAIVARRVVGRLTRRFRDTPPNRRLTGLASGRGPQLDPRRAQRIESIGQVVRAMTTMVVWAIGIMMALGSFGVNLGPLVASAGIVGVALGFGAQSLVKDFLSGMFMLAEDQFGVGDIVDLGEATGVVESISLRTTSVRGVDGTLWFVPNGEILRVGNMSQEWARALLDISVAYDADVDAAVEVISAAAREFSGRPEYQDKVLEPPEILGVEDLGADAVVIRLWIKTVPGEQYGLARSLRRDIKLALDEAGIAIPFPQRTVWLRHDGDADNLPPGLRPEPSDEAGTGEAGSDEAGDDEAGDDDAGARTAAGRQ
jgi:small-conductance mechanosensitive channel